MVISAPHDRPLTAKDLAELPDDGTRYELIWGELYMSPAPNTDHQRAVAQLHLFLAQYLREHRIGEVFLAPYEVMFDNYNVVQPDLILILDEHAHRVTDTGITGPPDLCIEVLAPGSRGRDLVKKFTLCAHFGVREYWIIDPAQQQVRAFLHDGDTFIEAAQTDGVFQSHILGGLDVSYPDIMEAV